VARSSLLSLYPGGFSTIGFTDSRAALQDFRLEHAVNPALVEPSYDTKNGRRGQWPRRPIADELARILCKNLYEFSGGRIFYFPTTSSLFKSRALKPVSSDFEQT
jgi:hypothetical protein